MRVWAAGLVYVVGNAWVLERSLDAWRRGREETLREEREEEEREVAARKAAGGKGEKEQGAATASSLLRPAPQEAK